MKLREAWKNFKLKLKPNRVEQGRVEQHYQAAAPPPAKRVYRPQAGKGGHPLRRSHRGTFSPIKPLARVEKVGNGITVRVGQEYL